MRIAVIGSGTASLELPAHLRTLGGRDIEAFIVNPRLSAFAFTPYEELLVDLGYVDAAQTAAAQGCDALMINSFADYGIEAASAVLRTPVIGAGNATLTTAAAQNRRFAIVTVWPKSMAFIYQERLRAAGLAERCVGVWHVSLEDELARVADSDGVMARMQRHDGGVLQRLAEACRAAQAAGADAIALGCTCMAPIGEALQQLCTLPVYEPSRCGFRAALAAATTTLKAPQVSTSEHPSSVRNPQRIPALLDAWQGRASVAFPAATMAAATALAPPTAANEDACPVCIAVEPDIV